MTCCKDFDKKKKNVAKAFNANIFQRNMVLAAILNPFYPVNRAFMPSIEKKNKNKIKDAPHFQHSVTPIREK